MNVENRDAAIKKYWERLHLSPTALTKLAEAFQNELEAGLDHKSSLLMIPTMVDMLPQGHECGEYYAIDLGGTNLRVLYTRLGKGAKEVEAEAIESSPIPPEMQSCPVEELMDYVAGHLIDWSERHHCSIAKQEVPILGFCFSFPVEQSSVDSGKLLRWTKGYTNPGAVGNDPAKLLSDAFKRRGVHVHIGALVNDTVGTLAAARYVDGQDTIAAMIMGTGTNACYMELLGRITKWLPHYRPRTPDMVVNIEWPGFQAAELPTLEEDRQLDEESNNPGQQRFEKLTAGLYMGDIARRIILRAAEERELFQGRVPEALRKMETFPTKCIGIAAQDDTPDLSRTAGVLQSAFGMDPDSITLQDRKEVKEICAMVTVRSARLVAAAVCGIMRHLGRDQGDPAGGAPTRTCIAVDGGIFVRYGFYRELLKQGVRDILGDAVADQFELRVVAGGSAFGAACVAAATHSYMRSVGNDLRPPLPPRKFPARRPSATSLQDMPQH
ncbi:Hexokinase-1 [Coccomyxa sp. Obi]|nr:Hexokinase-1 [Coccomyxa sp. Obi]